MRIQNHKLAPWIISFFASTFFFYEFIQMSMFNAISIDFLKNFGGTSVSFSHISAAYSLSMICFLLPAGILLDLYSTKKIIIAFLLSVIGTLLFSFSKTPETAEAYRMISGIGGAFAFLSNIKLLTRWFPQKKMSLVVGLLITFAFLGGAAAQTPFLILINNFGWRISLRFLTTLGVIFILLICFFLKDFPENYEFSAVKNNFSFFKKVFFAVSNKQTILGGSCIMLMNLPIVLLGTTWGDLYFVEARGFSTIDASYVNVMLFFGIMIGSPIFGFYSDKIGNRKKPILFGILLTLLTSFFIFLNTKSLFLCETIFFFLGFFSSAQTIVYSTIVENNLPEISATASGIASIIIMGGGALFKILYGKILDQYWRGQFYHHIPLYSQKAFAEAMMILPIGFFVALLSLLFIKETFCNHMK